MVYGLQGASGCEAQPDCPSVERGRDVEEDRGAIKPSFEEKRDGTEDQRVDRLSCGCSHQTGHLDRHRSHRCAQKLCKEDALSGHGS